MQKSVKTLTFLLAAVVVMQEFSIGASGRETIFIVLHDWAEKTHTQTQSVWTHGPVVGGAQIGPLTYWVDTYCSTQRSERGLGWTKEAVDHWCESTGPCAVTTDASRASESDGTHAEESGHRCSLNKVQHCLNMSVSIFDILVSPTHTRTHSVYLLLSLWSSSLVTASEQPSKYFCSVSTCLHRMSRNVSISASFSPRLWPFCGS